MKKIGLHLCQVGLTFFCMVEKVPKRAIPAKGARLTLREIRGLGERTQAEVATAMGTHQGEVSVLEKREVLDTVRVDTLRRYVEALGGELELVAVMGSKRFTISG